MNASIILKKIVFSSKEMKYFLSLIFLLTFWQQLSAHAFYFAFAEINYNDFTGTVEATIIASAHDVETVFKEQGIISKSLDYAKQNKKEYYAINDDLNKHFSLFSLNDKSDSNSVLDGYSQNNLVLDGFEVLLNGNIQFYLSTKITTPPKDFKIKFDFLMDKYQEQQNKLTFRFHDKKLTYNYLTTNKIQAIKLD